MGLYTTLPSELDQVDIIVAGGGSAGCIIAARLSDADPHLSVLLIEGGPNNDNVPTLTHPGLLMNSLSSGSGYNLYYKANKSEALGGRELVVPAGGVLGGGSSVNLMMYTRAQRSDYDAWKMPGWSADEMLVYMKKLETYYGPDEHDRHGFDGPMHVSGSTYRSSRLENDFIASVESVGWPEIKDLQTMDAVNGVQRALRYVSPEGIRQDTAHQYIHPMLEDGRHPGLHVLLESQVKRVIFDKNKAIGVEYQPNPAFQNTLPGSTRIAKARKMVILSCGALGTPLILERSGVGDIDVLSRARVPTVVNLPGVGRHYQDHHMMVYSYKSSLAPEETLDAIIRGRLGTQEAIDSKAAILGWNSMDASCKLRPDEADIANLGPAFAEAWRDNFRDKPDRPLLLANVSGCFPWDPTGLPEGQYFSISTFSAYPFSRGSIHITGPDVENPPNFDTGFLSDPHDVDIKMHMWMYKKQRQIARRMKLFRGEVTSTHPQFPANSQGACTDGPLPGDARDLEYDSEDDKVIEKWLRENIGTTWHSLGTCKMAPRNQNGVVDANLNVYGVDGLKVADLSIPPSNIGANSNNTAMSIGEKAADIFIQELGLGKFSGY